MRAVNGTHGASAPVSVVFSPTSTAPAPTAYEIDGQSITLTYNTPSPIRYSHRCAVAMDTRVFRPHAFGNEPTGAS